MSPEQARGKSVDKRADIWTFGAVLYEMLTGIRPFAGDDVSQTLARVIDRDPDWSMLPSDLPSSLDRFLRRCLEKNSKQRIRDIGDVLLAMEGAFESAAGGWVESTRAPRPRFWQRPLPALLTAVALLGLGGLAAWAVSRPAPAMRAVARFLIPLPLGQNFTFTGRHSVAISPDGNLIAYIANSSLWLRPVDRLEATRVPGTETEARSPFFSPDGQWVGFFADGQLKRAPVNGGAPGTLCAATIPYGVSWGEDDVIRFGQPDGIWQVPGRGGAPELLIAINEGQGHGPQLLPGGDWLLFTLRPEGTARWDDAEVVVESLSTGDRVVLFQGGRDARYVETGHLVYVAGGVILAVPFDLSSRTLTAAPAPVVEGVLTASDANTGAAHFAIARNGTLAHIPGEVGVASSERKLLWLNADGEEEPLGVTRRAYTALSVSPDGTRAAFEVADGDDDVWLSELARGTLAPLTRDPAYDGSPLWSPDGKRVIFASNRNGRAELLWKAADGTGTAEVLAGFDEAVAAVWPYSWSRDGATLVVQVETQETDHDVGIVRADGTGGFDPLLQTTASERNPVVSPNGRWLLYASDETGQLEVYVQRFPDLGGKRQVSTDFGHSAVWSPDGRAIIYARGGPPVDLVRVPVEVDDAEPPRLEFGLPDRFAAFTYYGRQGGHRYFDISQSDQRLLMIENTEGGSREVSGLHVVLNWTEELKERVPVD